SRDHDRAVLRRRAVESRGVRAFEYVDVGDVVRIDVTDAATNGNPVDHIQRLAAAGDRAVTAQDHVRVPAYSGRGLIDTEPSNLPLQRIRHIQIAGHRHLASL